MSGMVHVIGAGLSGLSAALTLIDAGRRVTVHEAGPQAGGRCRSYDDRLLGCRVDNGNHLMLSGNTAVVTYLDRIGARETMAWPAEAAFSFFDVRDGRRWTVRPNAGRLPWWVTRPNRRVPGTRMRDYGALLRLLRAGSDATVAETLDDGGPLYRLLLEPLAIAALNTRPEVALASLLAAVVRETLARGGAACVPLLPRVGLSESLIDPALDAIRRAGGTVRLSARVSGLDIEGGRVTALRTADEAVPVGPGDGVVLAVPAPVAVELLPGLMAPEAFESIINVHFTAAPLPGTAPFYGLVGGLAEWVFMKPGHVSVTISAANRLSAMTPETIAATVWPEVARAIGLPTDVASAPPPAWRVVRERRATFAATSVQEARRPKARTEIPNLALGGDWVATGLPATIEGAIRSGCTAANVILSSI